MGFWIHDGCLDSRWISVFTMDLWIHHGFLYSRWISGFTIGFWIHDDFLDSRWIPGFTMDSWIHDGFLDSRWIWCSVIGPTTKSSIFSCLLGVRCLKSNNLIFNLFIASDTISKQHKKENVPNTTSKRLEREFGKKLQGARVRSTNSSEDVSDTNEQRAQVSTEREHTGIEMSGGSSQKTWWQTQSELCGVPNGISYELDKDRANRIKTLGNAIVPQIAREFGLAIKKVLADEDII